MNRVTIAIPPRPYEAVIANGLLEQAGAQLRDVLGAGPRRLFIVTIPSLRRRWARQLLASFAAAGFDARLLEMPDGELSKKLATVEQLADKLVSLGADRSAVLVGFGGGVVCDIAGLLASLYMRGVEVVHIPTTVLAQVDASIGGKTAVNLRAGKNLLGTFHQPRSVLIDPQVLSTLPEREFRAGLYESLKCGVIGRPELFERLEKVSVKALRQDADALEWIITESVKMKAEIVSSDERECGLRRVLNLGHTIGHALEAATGYGHFLHGEAVGWGMIAAARISAAVGKCDPESADRIVQAVLGLGPLPKLKARGRELLKLLLADKKTRAGVVHFVLPRAIGRVEMVTAVPEKLVVETVEELRRPVAR